MVFENRALKKIFGPQWDEVKGEWRKIHNEELNDLYCSPNIVRVIKPRGARGGVVVKALRYKPAGRGFDSRCCHCNFSLT